MERQKEGRRESGQPGERLAPGTPPRSAERGGPVLAAPPPHLLQLPGALPHPCLYRAGNVTALAGVACDVTVGPRGVFKVRAREQRRLARAWGRPDEKSDFQALSAQVVRWVRVPRGALVAMDAAATAGGRERAGARGPATRPSYPRSPRSRATLSARAVP